MLDDFRDKQDPSLDPLSEGSSLPWSKKIALLSLAIAIIGLFIFFTSDNWNSDSKSSKSKDELTQEVDALKIRVSDLEQKLQGKYQQMATFSESTDLSMDNSQKSSPQPLVNLKSLIEQELQEAPVVIAEINETPPVKSETPTPSKKPTKKADTGKQTYTVQKGDTLTKIAQKFYGSQKRWKRIIEANKDKLGSNQTLKAGMTLVIPKDE
jgi:LysM repeat protein